MSDNLRAPVVTFPSNSHKSREEKKETRKVEKVVSGKVMKRKKSIAKRAMENFIGEDVNNVGSYILYDVLIPAAKSTLSELFHGSIEMVFGEVKRGNRTTRERGRSYVSYDKMRYEDRRDTRRDISDRNRSRHNFDEIVLDSRGEAEEVLSRLVDLILDYQQATVSDLYDLVGIKGNFTDDKYGWTNLSSASVSRVRDGYVINLPRTVLLD